MNLPETGCLLRIFIGESDRLEGKPLYEWIIMEAKARGLAGATAWRAMIGYGANSRIHTSKILRLSTDMPVIIELVDVREKLEAFLDAIDPHLHGGLATLEAAQVRFYRGKSED